MRAAPGGLSRNRIAHFPARPIADEADWIDVLERRARTDEHPPSGQRPGRLQHFERGADDFGGLCQTALANPSAGEIPLAGFDEAGYDGFRATLDDARKKQWDAALSTLVNAKRVPLYKLVDGQPQAVMVRLGASDGTDTEISGGGLKAGDAIVTGERARE